MFIFLGYNEFTISFDHNFTSSTIAFLTSPPILLATCPTINVVCVTFLITNIVYFSAILFIGEWFMFWIKSGRKCGIIKRR